MPQSWPRRHFLSLLAAAPLLAGTRRAQAKGARVAIIGGGFGGSATARFLKEQAPEIDVVLITTDNTFVCCPGSNKIIGGFGKIQDQTVGYATLEALGIKVITGKAVGVDTAARRLRLADETILTYDKLVLSPGIGFFWDEIEGVSEDTQDRVPHAWQAGPQTTLLRRQLEAMPDGGVFAMVAPVGPLRCPPAVGERVSLAAHYLKQAKPNSKIVVFDAKSKFALQALFEEAWETLYPGMIEYRQAESDGIVRRIDPDTRVVSTDFDDIEAAVVNFIPRQRAGDIALGAGVADETGWCPVDPETFQSTLAADVYVIGDSAFAPPLPKAAATAVSVADSCAKAILRSLLQRETPKPHWHAGCFSLAAPDYGFEASTDFRLHEGKVEIDRKTMLMSPTGASADARESDAKKAEVWLRWIKNKVWG